LIEKPRDKKHHAKPTVHIANNIIPEDSDTENGAVDE
jgi:hypothetical protein